MKIKIVGKLRQDYQLDSGYEFHGVKYYGLILDEVKSGLEGNETTDIKISDDSPLAATPLLVGSSYLIYFNKKGAVDFVQPDNSAPSPFPFVDDKKK